MDGNDEEADVRLQRIAGDLLSEFDSSLESFLRKPAAAVPLQETHTKTQLVSRVRACVRARETYLKTSLLDTFQELPQLLDIYLARWLPLLADAFLESVERSNQRSGKAKAKAAAVAAASAAAAAVAATAPDAATARSPSTASLVLSLQDAVAKLLYTICKVRGEKVVVGFLPVETRHLEPLLGALEAQAASAATSTTTTSTGNSSNSGSWTWQERYLVLLWLSQLLLAPFDLATISTGRRGRVDDDEDDEEAEGGAGKRSLLPEIEGFVWPDIDPVSIPSITLRILPLAVRYLAVASKERDAARILLVRIAMRRDMQEIGIRDALVRWALASIDGKSTVVCQPYYYIGTLSFLAGMLSASASASDMDAALAPISAAVNNLADEDGEAGSNPVFAAVRSSALARKMMIKVARAVTVRYIQLLNQPQGLEDRPDMAAAADNAIETTIGYLLGRLADNDTPVRFAASKALSVITLRLPPEMAAQVSDAVLEALERNVLHDGTTGHLDLTAIDPLEWHGLMLTLAHLLYRRSPPLEALPAIICALQRGLAFERRSVSGSATGTNVRDAACFGIWALARRYTTAELQPLQVLQVLATDLVVAGCLDPADNIRRGSSAALQELIGRHPDIVSEGIPLVQAVDYHAVALRSRAVSNVAQRVTALSRRVYGLALREALMGWRGFADAGDAGARRTAATSFGQITYLLATAGEDIEPLDHFVKTVELLVARIKMLQSRQIEERHGFLLALAAVLDILPSLDCRADVTIAQCLAILGQLHSVLETCKTLGAARRPDLLAEAACRLIVSSYPIIQAAVHLGAGSEKDVLATALLSGSSLLAKSNLVPATEFEVTALALDKAFMSCTDEAIVTSIQTYTKLVAALLSGPNAWLSRQENDVIAAASDASLILLLTLGPQSSVPSANLPAKPNTPASRHSLITLWADVVCRPRAAAAVSFKARASGAGTTGTGYVFALTKAFALYQCAMFPLDLARNGTSDDGDMIGRALIQRWAADRSIDTRVALLQALAQSPALLVQKATSSSTTASAPGSRFRSILAAGLDDYTTDARGDVGSHVRLHALRATQVLWAQENGATKGVLGTSPTKSTGSGVLFFRVLRLAAEKLDRVRIAAQATLAQAVGGQKGASLRSFSFSSQGYFRCLLGLWEKVSADAIGGADQLSSIAVAAVAAHTDEKVGNNSASATKWMAALMRGYVTSADTGNEELIVASRAAMVDYVFGDDSDGEESDFIPRRQFRQQCLWQALSRNLPGSPAAATTAAGTAITPPDRIVVPTLEIVAFLFNAGVFSATMYPSLPKDEHLLELCRQVNETIGKAGSVRKVEACIKVYGAVALASKGNDSNGGAGSVVSCAKLAALLHHEWPRVRDAVVDELWGLGLGLELEQEQQPELDRGAEVRLSAFDALKGVDWISADATALQTLVSQLGLVR